MREIQSKSKKAKPDKKLMKEDEILVRKKSSNCDCACMCVAEEIQSFDYDAWV